MGSRRGKGGGGQGRRSIFKGDQGCHTAGRTRFGDSERGISGALPARWRLARTLTTREIEREREREAGGGGLTSEVIVSVNSGATSTLSLRTDRQMNERLPRRPRSRPHAAEAALAVPKMRRSVRIGGEGRGERREGRAGLRRAVSPCNATPPHRRYPHVYPNNRK